MTTDLMALADFIANHRITMTAERAPHNPNMDDAGTMDHWRVQLRMGRKRLTTYFSMGVGHKSAKPEADDVLDCLASDAAGFENAESFEGWCDEYGYDPDSRSAEKIYRQCLEHSLALRAALGDTLLAELREVARDY